MKSQHIKTLLKEIVEEEIPSTKVALWPNIQAHLHVKQHPLNNGGFFAQHTSTRSRRIQIAVCVTILVLVGVITTLIVPQSRVLAQEILSFFIRSSRDNLPVQTWQLTPIPATTTPDPGDINNATLTVSEVGQLAGFDVLEPAGLPGILTFVGATFEPEHHIARLFYQYVETNGLVLREAPLQRTEDCELCGTVGDSAEIERIMIGDNPGEYVEGTWKLTNDGPVWESDPYLKTLRWQANGIAFELLYMGPPDSLAKTDLIAIAESVK